ncbi:hypothetical protein QA599_07025 [Haloarculaceae archaeon H-GB1-1]|nr:hypothetical protein [Haloarculaceae archaeon H-GB1-1]
MLDKHNVTDFYITYDEEGPATGEITEEPSVRGTPYHKTPEELISKYQQSRSDYLKFESRHGCGNYVLIDPGSDQLRMITSSAFSGGYIVDCKNKIHVTSTLAKALATKQLDFISIDPNKLIHYLSRDIKLRMPLTTVFRDVYRLPPGTILTGNGESWRIRSYLTESDSPPKEFESVCTEICDVLQEMDSEPVLGFSGGADSTFLASMFQANDIPFRAVILDFGPGQTSAVESGSAVAEELGIPYQIIDHPRPLSDKSVDHIEECLSQDIIKPYAPALSTPNLDLGDDSFFITGNLPDKTRWGLMRDQHVYESTPLSPKTQIGKWLRFLPNFQYSDIYLDNGPIRQIYLMLVPRLMAVSNIGTENVLGEVFPPEGHNIKWFADNPSFEFRSDDTGSLAGLLSTGRPNVIGLNPKFSAVPLDKDTQHRLKEVYEPTHLYGETSLFEQTYGNSHNTTQFKEIAYHIIGQAITKQLSTFFTKNRDVVEVPMLWGPATSYFLSTNNDLRKVMYPRGEVRSYIKHNLSAEYRDIAPDVNSMKYSWDPSVGAPLIQANSERLEPENSLVLELIDGDSLAVLREVYDWASQVAAKDEYSSMGEAYKILQILNIELILKNVYFDP